MEGILGKKVGMTQIFGEHGEIVPVTVVQAGPCRVVQRKSADGRDRYEAVQLGLVEPEGSEPKVNKPKQGHFDKAGVKPMRFLVEFEVDASSELEAGSEVLLTMFNEGDFVDVVGTSKGKGFQGVIKRHGFSGGRATHGSMFHRAPGSIGNSAYPARVIKGKRLPGQTGAKRITTKNLKVIKVDEENSLLYIRGSVPGAKGGYVAVQRAKKG